MTIGDEKVVAWLLEFGDGGVKAVPSNFPGAFQVVRHSAYAELAADRDELKFLIDAMYIERDLRQERAQAAESQLAEERELRMSLESSWQQAEAQLAGLRGRVTKIADRWDSKNELNGELFAQQLYDTLAAADGATTGETK